MNRIEAIDEAARLLSTVTEADFLAMHDDEMCAVTAHLERVGRLADAGRAIGAAEIDVRSRFELGGEGLAMRHGYRRSVHLLEEITRASKSTIVARIRLGIAVRQRAGLLGDVLPPEHELVASALIRGDLGTDAATVITRTIDLAQRHGAAQEDLDEAERSLLEESKTLSADLIAAQARAWAVALDPDGVEPREERIHAKRSARLGREANGVSTLVVQCEPELAATLRTAFGRATKPGSVPVFLSEDDRRRGTNPETGELLDPRTREQLQYDALHGLITAGLRSNGQLKPTASVVAVIQLGELLAGSGVGWIENADEPVSAETIQKLVCDAGFRKLVIGANDEPLFLGTTERLFTAAQRKARAVIDGGCIWPQCQAPPGWCEMHHVLEVKAHDGPTDISNGVLLCAAHHHMLHHSDYRMRMVRSRAYLLAPVFVDPGRTWRALGRSPLLAVEQVRRRQRARRAG